MNKKAMKNKNSSASKISEKNKIMDEIRARYASEMFEDVLEPYLEELRKFQKLSMDEEAKLHCMGILKGIYKFEIDATTEFKDWSGDDPHVYFIQVLEEWEKGNKDDCNERTMSLSLRSLYLVSQYISLSDAEAQAIAYHDGMYVLEGAFHPISKSQNYLKSN